MSSLGCFENLSYKTQSDIFENSFFRRGSILHFCENRKYHYQMRKSTLDNFIKLDDTTMGNTSGRSSTFS